MSFWNLFRKNKSEDLDIDYTPGNSNATIESKFDLNDTPQTDVLEEKAIPDIPEELFIEKSASIQEHQPNNYEQVNFFTQPKMIPQTQPPSQVEDINLLYDYLNTDYEKQGYEDAMINPDTHNMNENLDNIKSKLFIVIAKVTNYYKRHLRTIEFHIDSRSRSGMIDTVDELISHKETAVDELKMVFEIEQDTNSGKGLSQNLFNSYRKGFRNGLAAISFDSVLKRKV